MIYHMVMARKQVLVQLEDDLVERLDAIAARIQVSRSELIRRAAAAMIEADEYVQADKELIEAYRKWPQDPEFVELAGRLAAQTAPEW